MRVKIKPTYHVFYSKTCYGEDAGRFQAHIQASDMTCVLIELGVPPDDIDYRWTDREGFRCFHTQGHGIVRIKKMKS